MIKLRDVEKTFEGKARVTALSGVNLTIRDGEMVAGIGPSGSGKSTLLNLMGGLDVPTRGSVIVAGKDLAKESEKNRSLFRRSTVSYIFQAYHLMPTLTANRNVALPLHLAGVVRREAEERRPTRSGRWASRNGPDTCPTSFRAGSARGWRSPAPSSPARLCSSPMNQQGTSTRRGARRSSLFLRPSIGIATSPS